MRILAVDPGLTTGWAFWDSAEKSPSPGETEGPMEFLDLAHRWVARVAELQLKNALVIAERFIITPETAKKTQAPWSLEISGGLRFLCHRYGVEYVQQTPSEAKRLIHDDRLKAMGWYQPGRGHANDAMRHLAYGLVRRNLLRLPATQ